MPFRVVPGARWPRRRARDDSGFSLAEVMVALVILSGTFIVLAVSMFAGMQATAVGRQSQQASDLATQAIEAQRAVPENEYGAIAMRLSDLTGDGRVVTCGASSTCIAPGSGLAAEPLQLSATGTVYPHLVTPDPTTRNGTVFQVATYISIPPTDSVGASYKRVTVFVSWTSYGKPHTRTQSTLITATRRGLPLPRYKLVVIPTALCKNPGNTAAFTLSVQNLGARDSFDVYADATTTAWSFYRDVDGDGAYTSTVDTALTNTNTNTYGETGLIDPNASVPVLAVTSIPSSAAASTTTYTFHTLSVAQPTAGSALQSKTAQLTVQTGACSGGGTTPTPTATATATATSTSAACPAQSSVPTSTQYAAAYTLSNYSLHNTATTPAGDSTSTSSTVHPLTGTAATSPTLYDYSTNVETGVPGLQVAPNSSATFRYTYGGVGKLSVAGDATLGVWAQPRANGSSAPGSFTVKLSSFKSDGTSLSTPVTGSYTTATWGCNFYRKIVVGLSLGSGFDLSSGDYFTLTLGVPNSAPGNMLFAYDTATNDQVFTVSTK